MRGEKRSGGGDHVCEGGGGAGGNIRDTTTVISGVPGGGSVGRISTEYESACSSAWPSTHRCLSISFFTAGWEIDLFVLLRDWAWASINQMKFTDC